MTTTHEPGLDEDELLTKAPAGADPAFFDRLYFNMHATDHPTPLVMIGAGSYPPAGVVDGYVIVVVDGEQRNVRFSDVLAEGTNRVGPLSWETVVPLERWRLRLDENPSGLTFDVEWAARTKAWRTEDIHVDNGRGGHSAFSHFFQSGIYSGELQLDGRELNVDGWVGQRDRSRGVRVVQGGQGLHLWVQAQLADRSLAFIMDENRQNEVNLCDGGVLYEDGRVDPVTEVRHALKFNADLDFTSGELLVSTASGEHLNVTVDGRLGGGFLAGGGYDGWHGKARGANHVEHERWPLDGAVTPRTLGTPMTDRPAFFTVDGEPGTGIFEFAHTRSSSFTYAPSIKGDDA